MKMELKKYSCGRAETWKSWKWMCGVPQTKVVRGTAQKQRASRFYRFGYVSISCCHGHFSRDKCSWRLTLPRQRTEARFKVHASGLNVAGNVVKKGKKVKKNDEYEDSRPSLPFGWSPFAFSVFLLNAGSALCGSNQIVIKFTEGNISADVLTLMRFGIATIFCSPFLIPFFTNGRLRRAALEMGSYLFVGYILQAKGLDITLASHGALTGTFTVLSVPILASLAGRNIKVTTWIAAMTAMLGVYLLTEDAGHFNSGDFLCIASAITFGVHKFRTEALTTGLDELGLMAGQLFVVSVFSFILVLSDGSLWPIINEPSVLTTFPYINIVYMGLATTAFVLYIEAYCLKNVSSPLAAMIYSSEPVWGALFAYIFGGERFSIFGATLVVLSSLCAQMQGDAED